MNQIPFHKKSHHSLEMSWNEGDGAGIQELENPIKDLALSIENMALSLNSTFAPKNYGTVSFYR